MTTELSYISEKYEDIVLESSFVPRMNAKGQGKLAFVEAIGGIVENKEGKEVAKLQFRFVCEGVGKSQVISFTGWLNNALEENSKLGRILKALKIVEFKKPVQENNAEFTFEQNFISGETGKKTLKLKELLLKLEELEGRIVLSHIVKEKDYWYCPDPKTFTFPTNSEGEFYKTDVTPYKKKSKSK